MAIELDNIIFSDDEQIEIATALRTAKPWEQDNISNIKRRIKLFHLGRTGETCCYCQRDLHGEFQMVIDVEHILPSSIFPYFTFELWNLSVSCKRCNMLIKKDKIDFLDSSVHDHVDSKHYKLVHPNFDNIDEHICRLVNQVGRNRLVKYVILGVSKGKFTYQYFKLNELEISTFNEAQGANLTDHLHIAAYEQMRARVNALHDPT